MRIFVFRTRALARSGDTTVTVGLEAEVEQHLQLHDLDAIFGGHVEYVGENDDRYLGVWGRRKTSCFRRLLRTSGAELIILRASPPARLRVWTTRAKR